MDGFNFAIKTNLINLDLITLSKLGSLVIESRLDLMDGIALNYAWNISEEVFDKVFNIICICSFLKSGINDFFYKDIDKHEKKRVLGSLLKKSNNSEHLLLYNLYKYIESSSGKSIFNKEIFKKIEKIYSNQKNKLIKLYNRYKIVIESINKTNSDDDIICSFNYGYSENRAFKIGNEFKYNKRTCDLKKSIFKFDRYNSIIFYSNIFINGKFNVKICSPYLLKNYTSPIV